MNPPPSRNQPCPCGSGKKYKHCCAGKTHSSSGQAQPDTTTVTLDQAIRMAGQHYVAGQLQQAESICQQVLAVDSNHANALHLLGLVAMQTSHHDAAIELIGRAAALAPNAETYYNLGNACQAKGDTALAIANYRRALVLNPAMAEAHLNLGLACHHQGRLAEAAGHYRDAIKLQPRLAAAFNNLGTVLLEQRQIEEALDCFERALSITPDYADAHANALLALREQGRLDDAIHHGHEAVRLNPDFAAAHSNLGTVLQSQGELEKAITCYQRALDIAPDYAEACCNMGSVLHEQNKLDRAREYTERALALNPRYAMAWYNLGNIFQDQVRIDEAIACYEKALTFDPNLMVAHCNLLFTYNYHPERDAAFIFSQYQQFARHYAEPPMPRSNLHGNTGEPERRIRIGYFSPDFREHSLAHFVEPILATHDHGQFEIFCYANHRKEDQVTARLREYADHWRNISTLSDEGVCSLIDNDGIDILVDLAGHTSGGRLKVFARKPAPIQITYLGYFMSTGLATVDYFLSDEFFTPAGAEVYFSESLYRLPGSALCYRPPADMPMVTPPPALTRGFVTFGSFSRALRLNERVIALWAEILHSVPGSRLVLNTRAFAEAFMREEFHARFARHGIAPDRVDLIYTTPQSRTWEAYSDIDITLDPFPHNAGTTSFESLWMGVPLVSLADRPPLGRFGASILHHLDLASLLAATPEDYVRIAVDLSGDLASLSKLRAGLRQRMAASPLCDEHKFTRNLESAYRNMWEKWQVANFGHQDAPAIEGAP